MEQKKFYQSPNVNVYEMKVQQMLCDSMVEPAREYSLDPEEDN